MNTHCNLSLAKCLGLSVITASVVLLAACGGGSSSPTSTTARVYAAGRIAGFGSIVVNGVHYDETNANVVDEDGVTHNSGDLKLGMMVEVDASDLGDHNNVTSATAQSITFTSLMRGPVASKTADSLVVLGQTVKVTPTTVFDDSLSGGLSAISVNDVVKIYGTLDTATGDYTATRIEPKSGAQFYSLRGSVKAYDATAKTLTIGTEVIDLSGTTVPDGTRAGSLVRVRLNTTQVNGHWVAMSVKSGLHAPQDNDHSEVAGTITDFTSQTSFSVDGLPVDASKATFPDGTAGLAKGVRVEVEGPVVNGVLVATKVSIDTDVTDQNEGFEVDGSITVVDTANSTFVVRGVTVSYAGSVIYVGGTDGDLKVNAKVEVHGALAADGATLVANKIKFDK